ncbi:hypothetical protein Bbelb_060680, partial [Branchiostoma belcheri]
TLLSAIILLKTLLSTITLLKTLLPAITLLKTLLSAITLLKKLLSTITLLKTLLSTITLLKTLLSTITLLKMLLSAITLLKTLLSAITLLKTLLSTITLLKTLLSAITLLKTLLSAITQLKTLLSTITLLKTLLSTITLLKTLLSTITLLKTLLSAITLLKTLLSAITLLKTLLSTITLLKTLLSAITLLKTLLSTITLLKTLLSAITLLKTLLSTITLLKTLLSIITLLKTLLSTITLLNTLLSTITLLKTLLPAITLLKTLLPAITLLKTLMSAITVLKTLMSAITLLKTLMSTITLLKTLLSTKNITQDAADTARLVMVNAAAARQTFRLQVWHRRNFYNQETRKGRNVDGSPAGTKKTRRDLSSREEKNPPLADGVPPVSVPDVLLAHRRASAPLNIRRKEAGKCTISARARFLCAERVSGCWSGGLGRLYREQGSGDRKRGTADIAVPTICARLSVGSHASRQWVHVHPGVVYCSIQQVGNVISRLESGTFHRRREIRPESRAEPRDFICINHRLTGACALPQRERKYAHNLSLPLPGPAVLSAQQGNGTAVTGRCCREDQRTGPVNTPRAARCYCRHGIPGAAAALSGDYCGRAGGTWTGGFVYTGWQHSNTGWQHHKNATFQGRYTGRQHSRDGNIQTRDGNITKTPHFRVATRDGNIHGMATFKHGMATCKHGMATFIQSLLQKGKRVVRRRPLYALREPENRGTTNMITPSRAPSPASGRADTIGTPGPKTDPAPIADTITTTTLPGPLRRYYHNTITTPTRLYPSGLSNCPMAEKVRVSANKLISGEDSRMSAVCRAAVGPLSGRCRVVVGHFYTTFPSSLHNLAMGETHCGRAFITP